MKLHDGTSGATLGATQTSLGKRKAVQQKRKVVQQKRKAVQRPAGPPELAGASCASGHTAAPVGAPVAKPAGASCASGPAEAPVDLPVAEAVASQDQLPVCVPGDEWFDYHSYAACQAARVAPPPPFPPPSSHTQ